MKPVSSYTLLLLLFLFAASCAAAQPREYKGKMHVTPLQLEQSGDSLRVAIDFDIRGVNVDSRRSISLVPVLVASGRSLTLPEVMVKGRANYFISRREVDLMTASERVRYAQNPPYAIVKGYKSDGQKRIRYRKTIAFEPWMQDARLDIREDLCGCGNATRSLAVSQLVNRVQTEPRTQIVYVDSTPESPRRRQCTVEVLLDFIVMDTTIRPHYMNNSRELRKLTDVLSTFQNDPSLTVHSVSVVGYSSPEGSLGLNTRLTEGRAGALVLHLLTLLGYPKEMYHVSFGGENWQGLLRMVEASDMQDKARVLSILRDRTITDDVRKVRLRQLSDGEPYRYMLARFYPLLRKAVCKIDYEVNE